MEFLIDPELRRWATARQNEIIDAIEETGSANKAAAKLGLSGGSVRNTIASLKRRAAAQGYAPENDLKHIIPEPFVARGHSTYYDRDGKPTQQWVKTRLDEQKWLEMVREAVSEFARDCPPIKIPIGPAMFDPNIIPWVQLGDAHLGMLAHESETGKNFDIGIAEREILTAFSIVVAEMPQVERVVLNDLGDFTHTENFEGVTQKNRNPLDVDTRFGKIIKAYSRIMRQLVVMLLEKAETVDVIVNQGNHSRTNDIWMAELLRVAFPERVNVLNNDKPFVGYRMGNTFVMTHHSDLVRPDRLPGVLITDFRQDYGETEFHYVDIGHIHHKVAWKEHPGIVIESYNTLSPGDKYHFDSAYRSRQSLTVVYRSRLYGEVGRRVLPIQEVWEAVKRGHSGAYVPAQSRAYSV